jgi:hypothetical protein
VKVHRHPDLAAAVAAYLREHPDASANQVALDVRARRKDVLRLVKAARDPTTGFSGGGGRFLFNAAPERTPAEAES